MKDKRGSGRLTAVGSADIPLREVSGACRTAHADGSLTIFAVGDRAAVVAWAELTADGGNLGSWQTADLHSIPDLGVTKRDAQIEAVCVDGEGRLLLVQEAPPRAELIDLGTRSAVATLTLDVPPGHPLARAWADPDGSRGEGAVLLANGHLLVAKEKSPPALLEFGPAGAEPSGFTAGASVVTEGAWPVSQGESMFVPLAMWTPDRRLGDVCEDFSDLEVGPDGRLYVLSDQSATIARVDDLDPGGGLAGLAAAWALVHLDGKPEGLTFDAQGRAIVALDTPKAKRNLVTFDPPIAG